MIEPGTAETVDVTLPDYYLDIYSPYAIVYVEWIWNGTDDPTAYVHRKLGDTYLGHLEVDPERYNVIAMVPGGDLVGVDPDGDDRFVIAGFEPDGQDVTDFFNQSID